MNQISYFLSFLRDPILIIELLISRFISASRDIITKIYNCQNNNIISMYNVKYFNNSNLRNINTTDVIFELKT